MEIREVARQIIEKELKAVKNVSSKLGDEIEAAVKAMHECKGRIVISGLGKSGHIGKKLAATLASTGTPSFFVHAAEALHGDLGMITKDDIVLAISNSGETKELIDMIPSIRIIGAKIISITGNKESTLAKSSDISIEIKVESEADPLNLAPTSSSTATLVVGDAIAIVLSLMKDFKDENFAVFHPGGSLGRKLLEKYKLEDIQCEG
ncbi:MAG: SIS domain-containing protein [Tepidanaerobacteraceae bacterium]|jgi:arabinose-5-phosphate isomerase|nr:SIS domain-containing protein [Tepidanaerobacter sp.]